MTDWWLSDDCPMPVRWLFDDCPMTVWWLSDDCLMTVRWLSMTVRWLPDDYPMTAQWLPDDMTVRWLSDDRLLTMNWLSNDLLITDLWLSTTFWWLLVPLKRFPLFFGKHEHRWIIRIHKSNKLEWVLRFFKNIFLLFVSTHNNSRVAQWKRAGPITQRSVDRNYALLEFIFYQIHF